MKTVEERKGKGYRFTVPTMLRIDLQERRDTCKLYARCTILHVELQIFPKKNCPRFHAVTIGEHHDAVLMLNCPNISKVATTLEEPFLGPISKSRKKSI